MSNMNLTGGGILTFSLSGDSSLSFTLDFGDAMEMELVSPEFVGGNISGDIYTGETTVTPNFNSATLYTANKLLMDNITVNPIQVENVSNLSGGITVYIGGII